MSWRFPLRKKDVIYFWCPCSLLQSSSFQAAGVYCLLKVHVFGKEYGDDPFKLVCYSQQRLQNTFLSIWDVPSHISFVCCQPPSASHPSSCSSLAHVIGWFMTIPFSRDTLCLSALLGCLQCMQYPGWFFWESPVTCCRLASPLRWHCISFIALWVVGQCWLPAPSLLSRLTGRPEFQGHLYSPTMG